MNKTEPINRIAESANIGKKSAGDAIQAFMVAVTQTLKKNNLRDKRRHNTLTFHGILVLMSSALW